MSPNVSEEHFRQVSYKDLVAASHTLMAASGIVTALSNEYSVHGVLAVGALRHVTNMIDQTIGRLGLDTVEDTQERLPF